MSTAPWRSPRGATISIASIRWRPDCRASQAGRRGTGVATAQHPRKDAMRGFKDYDVKERLTRAAEARQKAVEKFKGGPGPADPGGGKGGAKPPAKGAARAGGRAAVARQETTTRTGRPRSETA